MQGFFKIEKKTNPNSKSKKKSKAKPKKWDCSSCGLDDANKIKVTGTGDKKILIIGESPTKLEEESGIQLIGDMGQQFRKKLKDNKINLDLHCWKMDAVACRVPNNKQPSDIQIKCCRRNVLKAIEELKPKKIILLGKTALMSYLGHRTIDLGRIDTWVGYKIPDQETKAWVYPLYPLYMLKTEKQNKPFNLAFDKHLEQAISHREKFPNYSDYESKIELINNSKGACIFLESLKTVKEIAFDYETTGKKPHAPGHEIVCMSITTSNKTVAFPLFDNKEFLRELRRVLQNKKIKKIAHGYKFENTWTKFILGYDIKGPFHCTMIGAHCIDNRPNTKGLKFQTFINFGILGYDNEIAPYLKSKSKNANAFNRVKEAEPEKLWLYCGADTYFDYELYQKQKQALKGHRGFRLFTQGISAFIDMENNGIQVDSEYYVKQDNLLEKKMSKLESKILESEEALMWKKKENKDLNINSPIQLKKLLYTYLKLKPVKETAKGNPSVDVEALEKIKLPFIKKILQWRKLDKLKNTYLAGFIREPVNGILRPSFNLHIPVTYRSSSQDVNFQNIPVRDEEAKKITRNGIIPRKGNQLGEVDISGAEVRIAACYNHDPELLKYIHDPTTDMHRDTGMDIFVKNEVTSFERYQAKNGFVFPQFYGDYFINCAKNIWQDMKPESKKHLESLGVTNLRKFERHIQKIESIFWGEKFKVYSKWKDAVWEEYEKTGYVDLKTGFRCLDLAIKNELINKPIQGTAFHILLWSLIQINKILKEDGFKTMIIGQIHDSIVFDIYPPELEELKIIIKDIMTVKVREFYKWIIVPLEIEMEVCEVDEPWTMKKEIEI